MGGLFGGSTKTPAAVPEPPDTSAADAAAREAASKAEAIRRAQSGRAATIMTGATGDTSEAQTQTAKLLGS